MPDVAARTIWVGGLPKGVHEDELLKAFGRCGRVVETKIRHSQIDTFAFVTFEDDKSYDRALKTMDQSKYFGSPIKVNIVITKTGNDGRGNKGGGRSDSRDRQDDGWKDNGRQSAGRRNRAEEDDAYYDPPPRRSLSRPAQRQNLRRGARNNETSRGRGQYDDRERDRGHYDDRERDRAPYDDWDRDRRHYDDRERDHGGNGRGRGAEFEVERRREPENRWRDDRNRERSPEYDRGGGGRRRLAQPSPSPDRRRDRDDEEISTSRLWVGGMPKDVTEREMERTFSKHGPVQEIVIRHSEFDTFGFVQFKNTAHAAAAIKELNQTERFGGIIKVAPAGGKGDKGGGKKGGSEKGGGGGGGGKGRKGGKKDDWRSRSPRRLRSPSPRGRRPQEHEGKGGKHDKGGKHGGKGRRSPPPRSQQQGGVRYCIKLGLLPPDMDVDELFDLGDSYGQVLHHSLWADEKNECLAGVIEYGVRDEAIKALNDLNDRRMDGWDKKITAGLQQRDG